MLVKYRDGDFEASATGLEAVQASSEVVRERLREREKTRRLLLLVAASAFLVGAIIITFAPADKQNIAYILGAVMIISVLGSIGASQLVLKMLGVEVSAKDERLLQNIVAKSEISK